MTLYCFQIQMLPETIEQLLWGKLFQIEVLLYRLMQIPEPVITTDESLELQGTLQSLKTYVQEQLRNLIVGAPQEQSLDVLMKEERRLEEARAMIEDTSKRVLLLESTSRPISAPSSTEYEGSTKLKCINGKWTRDETTQQRNAREAVRRLKKDYDQQVKNLWLLEKERNELQTKVASLEDQFKQMPKGRRQQSKVTKK